MDTFNSSWFYVLAALGFGFVIFIHELGHFLFAKWAGVRVERFSIGFGPVLFRKTIGETEYALSLLPLGGYVKMLGQEDMPADIPDEVKLNPRSYLAVGPVWQALILLAGVLFNLVSSYLILLCVAWHGMPIVEPVVGAVAPTVADVDGKPQPSPAVRLGLHQGDRILTINGKPLRSFDDLSMTVVTAGNEPLLLTVARRDTSGAEQELTLPAHGTGVSPVPDYGHGRPTLGVEVPLGWRIDDAQRLVGSAKPDDPTAGDRIIAINGEALSGGLVGQQVRDRLLPFLGREVKLTLERSGKERTVAIRYAGEGEASDLAFGFPARVAKVEAGSAAEAAGLQPGDLPVKVDDQPVAGLSHFIALTRAAMNQNRAFTVTVWRDGKETALVPVQGGDINGRRLFGAELTAIDTGFLPILPRAFDGEISPLELAGIHAGDAIIDRHAAETRLRGDAAHVIELTVVSGGQPRTVALPLDDLLKASHDRPALALFKLFGASGTPSLLTRLQGMRVESTGNGLGYPAAGFIQIADRDGVAREVNLDLLSKPTRDALLAGLQPGDWIAGLTVLADGAHALQVIRGADKPRDVQVKPKDIGTAIALGVEMHPYRLHAWTEAFSIANDAAYNMVVKTVQIIPMFFRSTANGGIDANKSLSGPIGIFSALKGNAEKFGFDSYLNLLALIGLNLFLVNLLPIPITDGGQLVLLAIETAMRRPLPAIARNAAMWVGLVMVMGLMLYVVGLDLLRHAGVM